LDKPAETSKPRWGQARRLAFIDLRLQYDGRINRKDIQEFFDISTPQATADLDLYSRCADGNLRYDFREKAYLAEPSFVPQFGRSAATRYLDDLYRLAHHVVEEDESFVGYKPSVGVVATPTRTIESSVVAVLVRAMRDNTALDVVYASMNKDSVAERVITPHAMAFDGLRWHVRAWCHTRNAFRDFAIGRMHVRGSVAVETQADPSADIGWHTTVDVVLKPHPNLKPHQLDAVVRDYDMKDGFCTVPCRQAMLFYTLRHLNLERADVAEDPARQHVILANRPQVEAWIAEDRDRSLSS
jgi:hypothetical protein